MLLCHLLQHQATATTGRCCWIAPQQQALQQVMLLNMQGRTLSLLSSALSTVRHS
jgi:predicted RNA-binding protein YlxR (DUF448 family)